MNKHTCRLFTLTTIVALSCTQTNASFFKKAKDRVFGFFSSYSCEQVINKEYKLENPGTLTLNNFDGNITIETDWESNSVCLKATKRASKEEILPDIIIKDVQKIAQNGKEQNVTIATAYKNDEIRGQIDYELMVPANMRLQLTTQQGNIMVNNVNAPIAASTTYGNIEMNKTQKALVAQTQKTGNITINDAHGAIQATTNSGNIMINDATESIVAYAERGTIKTACAKVPETSTIKLDTHSGAIMVALPSETNATLRASTERGTLVSDHYVQLKTRATKLNKATWNQFKREVEGTMGTGAANIELHCKNGNIKIMETATA